MNVPHARGNEIGRERVGRAGVTCALNLRMGAG